MTKGTLRAFIGMETAALIFRTKQYSTSNSSLICYGKRFSNDFFLNHNTIALVHNCLKITRLCGHRDYFGQNEKESIILTVSFRSENVPFGVKSYRFVRSDRSACSQINNYDSFSFRVFEKRLAQVNCSIFCKKRMICLTVLFS